MEVLMSQGDNTLDTNFWNTQKVLNGANGDVTEPTIDQIVSAQNEEEMMRKKQEKFKKSKYLKQQL